jgi:thiol-disulfide isomerase/thioredoxin
MMSFSLLHLVAVNILGRPHERSRERSEYADKAGEFLTVCQSLRQGDTQESTRLLDGCLAQALYWSAYDIPDYRMKQCNPDILRIWQQAKEYFDTYDVNAPGWTSLPLVRRKLMHVPFSGMQVATRKFEQTYGDGKIAPAPAINVKSWITTPISKEQQKGRVVLLDFWNIKCVPCVRSLPDLQRLHDQYKDQGLLVITCAGGTKRETKAFLDEHGYNFPAGMASRQMCLDYAIGGVPSYFLIDRSGNLVWGPEHRLPTDDELITKL